MCAGGVRALVSLQPQVLQEQQRGRGGGAQVRHQDLHQVLRHEVHCQEQARLLMGRDLVTFYNVFK